MDGDELRKAFDNWDFSPPARHQHNLTVARLALTFSKQMSVMVSVIAPSQHARDDITNICNPLWVYLKRDSLPDRQNHFYEVPQDYFTVNTDELDVDESIAKILSFYWPVTGK